MKISKSISSVFNIKEGEGSKIILLMLYSFFLGLSMAYFYTISTTLFLTQFKNSFLPIAYMGGGLLTWVAGIIYSRFQQKIAFSKLLQRSIFALVISISCFIILQFATANKWVYFVMFAWFSVSMFIYQIGFWQLSSTIFDLRQGKRLFGLINTGEVISSMISFFSIPLLLKFMKTENMLYITMLGLICGLIVLTIIIRKFSESFHKNNNENNNQRSLKEEKDDYVLNRSFIIFIFVLAILPTFATYFVDFIFFTQSKIEYPEKEVLATFLGTFLGILSILELLIRSVVSGKILNKYGIKLGLLILPIILIFSFFFATITGSIYGTLGVFFSFISLSKLFMRIVRTSLHEPSFQILYQIIPISKRFGYQSKIETGKAIGHLLVGLILLIFTLLNFSLIVFSAIFLLILSFWIYVAVKVFHSYRASLKTIIAQKDAENVHNNINDQAFYEKLVYIDNSKLEYILSFVYEIEPSVSNSLVSKLIADRQVRNKTVPAIMAINRGLVNVLPVLESIKTTDNDEVVKYKEILKNYATKNISELLQIINEPDKEKQIIALHCLGNNKRYEAMKVIATKLIDHDTNIRKAAIAAAGVLRKKELFPFLLDCLTDLRFSIFAAKAIVQYGEEVLTELENHFIRMENNYNVRYKIIEIYENINTKRSIGLLRNKINYPDKNISSRALIALSKIGYNANHSESSVINENIFSEIADIVYLYQSFKELANIENAKFLSSAINNEIENKRERIYLLLALLYDSKIILQIRNSLERGNQDAKGFALEIMDITISEENKNLLIPFFENLGPEETIEGYKNLYPQENLTLFERIENLINYDYTRINLWIKSLAIDYLKNFEFEKTVLLLSANLVNSNLILSETAAIVFHDFDTELFFDEMVKHKNISKEISQNLKRRIQTNDELSHPLLTEKIKWLKNISLFSHFYQADLMEIAEHSDVVALTKNTTLSDFGEYFYILNRGNVQLQMADGTKYIIKRFEIIGDISETYYKSKNRVYEVTENSVLLRLSKCYFYTLVSENIEAINAIIEK